MVRWVVEQHRDDADRDAQLAHPGAVAALLLPQRLPERISGAGQSRGSAAQARRALATAPGPVVMSALGPPSEFEMVLMGGPLGREAWHTRVEGIGNGEQRCTRRLINGVRAADRDLRRAGHALSLLKVTLTRPRVEMSAKFRRRCPLRCRLFVSMSRDDSPRRHA
ncbi:MAG: hypothetical protein QOI10_3937 [Solirubrobacterales bacterium]|nr:hypothetical protein [Pseudonocardiales bacterium]MDX6584753.1 hypothetical protein [Solirubrobacterales bacterium]